MSSRVRKQSEPMKAFVPVSSLLVRGTGSLHSTASGGGGGGGIGYKSLSATLSPPVRHISPEHAVSGNRSPGALTYKGKVLTLNDNSMRRTASLDALYLRPAPAWNLAISNLLQLDKATQTEDSFLERTRGSTWIANSTGNAAVGPSVDTSPIITRTEVTTPTDLKVIRQRLQRTHRGEHSVSSQTLSPNHAKASPVLIPPRTCPPIHMRPMRNSVEGLNQEIEKLVLYTGQSHTCRSDLEMYSRSTPEGHRAPLADLFHATGGGSSALASDTRSVNTQTPLGDTLSSDDGSQSTSPDEGTAATSASPRINKFLAREPPDGCEKVNLRLTEADTSTNTTHFKPCVAFQLRPSLGSAFQPLQPLPTLKTTPEDDDGNAEDTEIEDPPSTEPGNAN
ncbi:protein FAM117B-like [Toxorhynchites rutilus septentrionalis]|uniref:protein FAM117B-like n=1 Tax=Toxorhynchites rutilus septentrionalis TaxID=329112 RepID=UPI0024796B5A|nr:protein FAM117B-like [Toxorhynchites rutilus septentrionalis]